MKNLCKSELCEAPLATVTCNVLGPYPATTVAALADLGLSDQEIAGYFHVQPERIAHLRRKEVPELRLTCHSSTVQKFDFNRE